MLIDRALLTTPEEAYLVAPLLRIGLADVDRHEGRVPAVVRRFCRDIFALADAYASATGDADSAPASDNSNSGSVSFVTAKEAAKLAGVDPRTITEWCKTGRVKAVRVGRPWLVNPTSLPKGA